MEARFLVVDGVRWVVRAGGLALGGGPRSSAAPLVLLTFALAGEPERPVREVLRVGRGLDALGEEELVELLASARPFAGSGSRPPTANADGSRGRSAPKPRRDVSS